MLEELYREALGCKTTAKFSSINSKSVLYKGFKMSLNLETFEYNLLDIRKTDFYSSVNDSDFALIVEHGFIKGCDLIMKQRDEERIKSYTRRLEKLYTLKAEYKKDVIKNKKRLGICEANISETIDLLFFYKARLIQNKEKYE